VEYTGNWAQADNGAYQEFNITTSQPAGIGATLSVTFKGPFSRLSFSVSRTHALQNISGTSITVYGSWPFLISVAYTNTKF
jgi:hypothetical protein